MTSIPRFILFTAVIAGLSVIQVTTTTQPPQPRQRDELSLIIGDRIGTQPSFAVPDCLTLTPDEATAEAARTIARVLWDDLEFEREFRMIARDIYRTIPVARSLNDLPFDRWQELGADGVISCTVEATSDSQIEVTARLLFRCGHWSRPSASSTAGRTVTCGATRISCPTSSTVTSVVSKVSPGRVSPL